MISRLNVVKDHTILEFESNSQRARRCDASIGIVVKDHTILEFESNSQLNAQTDMAR